MMRFTHTSPAHSRDYGTYDYTEFFHITLIEGFPSDNYPIINWGFKGGEFFAEAYYTNAIFFRPEAELRVPAEKANQVAHFYLDEAVLEEAGIPLEDFLEDAEHDGWKLVGREEWYTRPC